MLPDIWHKEILDLNIFFLYPQYIIWADYVFVSAALIQEKSLNKVLHECRKHNVKIVAEGQLVTEEF